MSKKRGRQLDSLINKGNIAIAVVIVAALFLVINSNDAIGYSVFDTLFGRANNQEEVEGTILHRVIDSPEIQEEQYLEAEDGKFYKIKKEDSTGTATTYPGLSKQKIKKKDLQEVAPFSSSKRSGSSQLTGAQVASGSRLRTLAILGTYKDYPNTLPCTVQDVTDLLFTPGGVLGTSVNEEYFRSTHGNVEEFFGDVVGVDTLSHSYYDEGCSDDAYISDLRQYASSQGYNINNYDRVAYVMPRKPGCWSWGYKPGKEIMVYQCDMGYDAEWYEVDWLKSSSLDVFVHEFGHNFGMGHARAEPPHPIQIDHSDQMGGGAASPSQYYAIWNAPHYNQMSWSKGVIDAPNGGKFHVSSMDSLNSLDPDVIRADCGFYAGYTNIPDGIESESREGYKVDEQVMVYRHSGGTSDTYARKFMDVGGTYTEEICEQTFRFVSRDADKQGAVIEVLKPGQTTECIRNTPDLILLPDSQITKLGAPKQYTVSLTNKDSQFCGPTTFLLDKQLDIGLTGEFEEDFMIVYPRDTEEVLLTVNPPSSQTEDDKRYSIIVYSSSNEDQLHNNQDSAILTVDKKPPGEIKDLSASPARRHIDLLWTAADDNIGIGKYLLYRDNTLYGETSSTSYRDSNVVKGIIYSYYVIPEDKAGNQGPQSNTVQAELISKGGGGSGGGGKGGGDQGSCTDTDGGKNYLVKGIAEDGVSDPKIDFCQNDRYLMEGFCDKGDARFIQKRCNKGCLEGQGICAS